MFEVLHEDNTTLARIGILHTAHGKLKTPVFMPVATKGSTKLLSNFDLEEISIEAIIANAFLLYLRPGTDIIKKFGGLHKFMGWKKAIFTDSGGFQILRESMLIKNTENGVVLKSPFDGSKHLLTPELCIKIQNELGSDVAMQLDDVPKLNATKHEIIESMRKTVEWAKRCKKAHKNKDQLLFCIGQGGFSKEFRAKCIAKLSKIGFDGYAIGGLCIGEPLNTTLEIAKFSSYLIPKNKPRYLMGVGSIKELLECISYGIDIFDSAFPTRMARHGVAFIENGKRIDLRNRKYAEDFGKLDEKCKCKICKRFSKAYIHHLFRANELNALAYLSYHNVYKIQKLIEEARKQIKKGKFGEWKKDFLS